MTSEELIAKIKTYIERRKKSLRAGICNEEVFTRKQRNEMLVASEELDRLNRFLSTLESENPMNQDEDLEEEIDIIVKCEKEFMNFKYKSQLIGYIARHFARWGAEHAKNGDEKPAPNDGPK